MKVGQKVHYLPFKGCDEDKIENGIIKSINGSNIFIVFKCNDEWENYMNYTGHSCNPNQIKIGWYGFTPELFFDHGSNDYYIHGNFHIHRYLNEWKIERIIYDISIVLYNGKISTNNFALSLFGNLEMISNEDIIKINRELVIDDII